MKKDFLVILWLGLRGIEDASVAHLANFFFKMLSGVVDRIWRQLESLVTELFLPDYISRRIVTSWFLFN